MWTSSTPTATTRILRLKRPCKHWLISYGKAKALYVGISKYPKEAAEFAYKYLEERDVHCLLYQGRYNLFNREPEEEGILQQAKGNGTGFIAFSPLAQGLLTNRYLNGIPEDSRMAKGAFLKKEALTDETLQKIKALNEVAASRGQTLAEMSLAWLLKDDLVTSVIIGASSVAQLADNLKATENTDFSAEELEKIKKIIQKINQHEKPPYSNLLFIIPLLGHGPCTAIPTCITQRKTIRYGRCRRSPSPGR